MRPGSDGRLYRRRDDRPRGPVGADRGRTGRARSPPASCRPSRSWPPPLERADEVAARRSTASPRSGSTTRCWPPTRRAGRRPRRRARDPPRRARRRQGHHARRRPPHDARLVRLRALGARSRRLRRHRPAPGRGDHHRPDDDARSSPTRCRPTARCGASPATRTTSTRTPGGSSGGSGGGRGLGVRAAGRGLRHGRLGAHPGGLVRRRRPQAGLGRIPMDVLPGLFDSISHHGPLARCADDARLFLAATQGPDDADIMSVPGPLDLVPPARRRRLRACGSGLSVDLGCFAVDPEIAAAVTAAAERLGVGRGRSSTWSTSTLGRGRRGRRGASLWSVFMATYYGDVARGASASAWIPTSSALIDARSHRVAPSTTSGVEIHRTDLWRRLAADPRRPRRAAVPDDGRAAVAGGQGRPPGDPADRRRRATTPPT